MNELIFLNDKRFLNGATGCKFPINCSNNNSSRKMIQGGGNGEILVTNKEDYSEKCFLLECFILIYQRRPYENNATLRHCKTFYPKSWNEINVGDVRKIYNIETLDRLNYKMKDIYLEWKWNKDSSDAYLLNNKNLKNDLLNDKNIEKDFSFGDFEVFHPNDN